VIGVCGVQARRVEGRVMENPHFQRVCFRLTEGGPCAPPFSFASFMYLEIGGLKEGHLRLQPECVHPP
jgi:hypothetical protein